MLNWDEVQSSVTFKCLKNAVGLLSKESTIWVIESTIKKSQNRSKIVDSLDFLSKQFLKKVLDLSKQFFEYFLLICDSLMSKQFLEIFLTHFYDSVGR